jgi:uncharacterized membrane protein
MFERSLMTLTFVAALGSGLVAGVFFAFSTFVMPALARIRPDQGIAAMQSINVTVINPLFMLVLFGTAVVALLLILGSSPRWGRPGQWWIVLASVLYVFGTVGVTMICNVPLNSAMAEFRPGSADVVPLWERFLKTWTLWNHVRTLASTGACALYIAAASS